MPVAVHVNHPTRKFGDLIAVDDVSFKIGQGEIFGMLGPNGAGKSTILAMLSTILKPSSGEGRRHDRYRCLPVPDDRTLRGKNARSGISGSCG